MTDDRGPLKPSAGQTQRCGSALQGLTGVLGYKFVALGHNTVRGAAGAAVLNAELMRATGLLERN